MKTYSISYDLGNPGRDYEAVKRKILSIANGYCRPTESQWLVNSHHTAAHIRGIVAEACDSGDRVFVHEVGNLWASHGLPKSSNDWLQSYWRSACSVNS